MKGFYVLLVSAIFITDSCCSIPRFVQKGCIKSINNTTHISDINYDVAVLENGRKSQRVDVFLSFFADTAIKLKPDRWTVLSKGNKRKIKKLKIANNNKWQNVKEMEASGKKLISLSFYEKVKSGDRIELSWNPSSTDKDDLCLIITIPQKYTSKGFFDKTSVIGNQIPRVK